MELSQLLLAKSMAGQIRGRIGRLTISKHKAKHVDTETGEELGPLL